MKLESKSWKKNIWKREFENK